MLSHDAWGTLLVVRDSRFRNCSALLDSGVSVHLDTGSAAAFVNTTFVRGAAGTSGGAVSAARTVDPELAGYSGYMLDLGYSNRWLTLSFLQFTGYLSADMAAVRTEENGQIG